jgi:hypothetical protein
MWEGEESRSFQAVARQSTTGEDPEPWKTEAE